MAIDNDNWFAMYNLEMYYKNNNLFVKKIIDFYQHNIEM